MTRHKTLAAWLALVGGPLGLHRFYLYGMRDRLGWILPVPSVLGIYGVMRMQQLGLDDRFSWLLIPLLGFTIAGCALTAIVYGLTAPPKWNARYNPSADAAAASGNTSWLTIGAVILSLLVGTTALISSLAFSFQHYFEYQRTALARCVAPTPTMAPVMVCVVDTGMPSMVAVKSLIAPPVSAQNPCTDLSSVRRCPIDGERRLFRQAYFA